MKRVLIIETVSGSYLLAAHLIRYTTWAEPETIKTYRRPSCALNAWGAFKKKFACSIRLKPVRGYVVKFEDLAGVMSGTLPFPEPLT
ncbi:hypothetical protein [Caudoviricetes sp.]|nr:hypothetical protein [Caudoviricetes sp.]